MHDLQPTLYQTWFQTNWRLDHFLKRVQEGRDVLPSLEFARYVLNSGIVPLLEQLAEDGVQVDAPHLRWKAEELQRACTDRLTRNNGAPDLSPKNVQSLHEKLDSIAGYLSQVASSLPSVPAQEHFHLTLISGASEPKEPVASSRKAIKRIKVANRL